jgi:hypothetical protein
MHGSISVKSSITTSNHVRALLFQFFCRNPSLGLSTKARCGKVAAQEGDMGVTSHAPGSAKNVRK